MFSQLNCSWSLQVATILPIWYLKLQPPTLWVLRGQNTYHKTLVQHYPAIPLCSLINFEQNSTQQNVFQVGYAFKTANRWLSWYFDLNVVWLVYYSVSGQKSNTFVTSLQIYMVMSERVTVKKAKYIFKISQKSILQNWSGLSFKASRSVLEYLSIFEGLHATHDTKLHENQT